ncbi:MAG TPA: TIGR02452 family protein [Longimicrobium sp.]|nr:TIGR02452 family protein [Longimicrobium sp.]
MNRERRAALARETLEILSEGRYAGPSGRVVEIGDAQQAAVAGSLLYRPHDFPDPLPGCPREPVPAAVVEVTGETTLQAARRLADADPVCLNFASARNPGGGFLSGSQAQEESLARSSGLYPCLQALPEMYQHNRQRGTLLYSDHMIYSPRVPVFRGDGGGLLEEPFLASFITAPAVNAGAVRLNEPGSEALIRPTMAERLRKVLWVAAHHGHRVLVLGAWGCGVFGNDPRMIAGLFGEALGPGGLFARCFDHVAYAVFDRTPDQAVLTAFREVLDGTSPT